VLSDRTPFQALDTPDPDAAFQQALKQRKDLAAAAEQVKGAQATRKAAVYDQLPTVVASGNYGDQGETFGHSHGTYTAEGQLAVPILQIAKTRGEEETAGAQLDQAKDKLSDQVQQVNADVRDAILDIQTAAKLVEATQSNVELAREALSAATLQGGRGYQPVRLPGPVNRSPGRRPIHQRALPAQRRQARPGACSGRSVDELQRLPRRKVSVADQNAPAQQPEKPEAPPKDNSTRRFIIIAVVAVLVIGAALFYWRSTFTEDTDDAQVNGNLYQVSSRVSGQVIHVDVEEQQFVHAGDPIAEIDPKDSQVALEQAQANLANAEAEYQQAVVNVPITSVQTNTTIQTSGSDVLGSQAQVEQAQAQKSALDVQRYTPLVAKDVISKQQFDAAVAQAAADEGALEAAKRDVAAQEQTVNLNLQRLAQSRSNQAQSEKNGPKQVAVQQARASAALASIKVAQAKVDQAQLNLSYTKIVAPITGIVSNKSVAVGENLSVGQSLMTIVPLTDLWVTANFKETQLKEMHKGQEVDIEVDALGGRKFTGKVEEIGGATGSSLSLFPPENATGNYVKVVQRIPVRINFTNLDQENKDFALRIGMSVEPKVRVKE